MSPSLARHGSHEHGFHEQELFQTNSIQINSFKLRFSWCFAIIKIANFLNIFMPKQIYEVPKGNKFSRHEKIWKQRPIVLAQDVV